MQCYTFIITINIYMYYIIICLTAKWIQYIFFQYEHQLYLLRCDTNICFYMPERIQTHVPMYVVERLHVGSLKITWQAHVPTY